MTTLTVEELQSLAILVSETQESSKLQNSSNISYLGAIDLRNKLSDIIKEKKKKVLVEDTDFTADSLVKGFDETWINKKFKEIKRRESQGKLVVPVGVHALSYATKEEFVNRLEKRGFKVEHSYNSHGVPTLVVTW